MPMRSKAQRKWMWANKPEMAQKWEDHTPKGAKLPEHVSQEEKKASILRKLSAALQPTTLIPGAPPVMRLPPTPAAGAPAGGQAAPQAAPQAQPAPGAPQQPQGAPQVPQQPQAPIPMAPTARDALTKTQAKAPMAAQPDAINNSEAVVAEKINKMAAVTYGRFLSARLKGRLGN